MNTYLFAWNPKKFPSFNLKEMASKLPNIKPIHKWKTSRINNIGSGDNFILVKLGIGLLESEKGIIGIGKIISRPYKDLDYLLKDEIVDYVDLEFAYIKPTPFISLSNLKKIDSSTTWTPQQNGNIIPESTYFQIYKIINKDQPIVLFEKKIYFPIIANEIDLTLTQQSSIHHDEIVRLLLEKYQSTLEKIAHNTNQSSLFIAQNMVDWFSAELTKGSDLVSEWKNKYLRTKIKFNGREITNYSLALNVAQDEFIEENNITYTEGSIKQVTVNAYERNPHARKKCLEHWKYSCQCCGFNFENTYGDLGKDYIHVHHIKPLAEIKIEYVLDPILDLIPVCANCHAMLHRRTPALSINELRALLNP